MPEPDEENQFHEVHFDELAGQPSILQDSATDDRDESDAEPAGTEQGVGATFQNLMNEITRGMGEACIERDLGEGDVIDLRKMVNAMLPILPMALWWQCCCPHARVGDPVLRAIDELPRHWNCLYEVTDVNQIT